MSGRTRIWWALSVLMLVWMGVMTLNQHNARACAESGGRWSMLGWECTPARRILLQRGLMRS